MNNPVVLVLPDIHGRDFYKDALKEAVESGIDIVCLGDLDPYPYEELHEGGVSRPLEGFQTGRDRVPWSSGPGTNDDSQKQESLRS